METVELEPQVLADRRGVVFGLVRPHGTIECVITLATPEAHFWLEPRVNDARILKTFAMATDASARLPSAGCSRIRPRVWN